MNITTDRRSFIHATSVTVLTAAAYSRVLGANERVALGLIGYGLIGKTHTATFSKIPACQIVGVADCHRKRADQGVTAVGDGATAYQDFRKLLDCKGVQAVIVATPDHWHALMGMMACAAGKDVYVEKPSTVWRRGVVWQAAAFRRNACGRRRASTCRKSPCSRFSRPTCPAPARPFDFPCRDTNSTAR